MNYQFVTKPTLLLFLGPQGSGKGTQVTLLQQKLDLPVITMGEIFRQESKKSTPRALEIKETLDRGGLQPARLWEPVLRDYLQNFQVPDGALLDGLVRSMEQVESFNRMRGELSLPEPYVVVIDVSEEESIKRMLLRARHDDTQEGIRERLRWSKEETEPVIAKYRALGRVIDVNGQQSVEQVQDELVTKLVDARLIRPV